MGKYSILQKKEEKWDEFDEFNRFLYMSFLLYLSKTINKNDIERYSKNLNFYDKFFITIHLMLNLIRRSDEILNSEKFILLPLFIPVETVNSIFPFAYKEEYEGTILDKKILIKYLKKHVENGSIYQTFGPFFDSQTHAVWIILGTFLKLKEEGKIEQINSLLDLKKIISHTPLKEEKIIKMINNLSAEEKKYYDLLLQYLTNEEANTFSSSNLTISEGSISFANFLQNLGNKSLVAFYKSVENNEKVKIDKQYLLESLKVPHKLIKGNFHRTINEVGYVWKLHKENVSYRDIVVTTLNSDYKDTIKYIILFLLENLKKEDIDLLSELIKAINEDIYVSYTGIDDYTFIETNGNLKNIIDILKQFKDSIISIFLNMKEEKILEFEQKFGNIFYMLSSLSLLFDPPTSLTSKNPMYLKTIQYLIDNKLYKFISFIFANSVITKIEKEEESKLIQTMFTYGEYKKIVNFYFHNISEWNEDIFNLILLSFLYSEKEITKIVPSFSNKDTEQETLTKLFLLYKLIVFLYKLMKKNIYNVRPQIFASFTFQSPIEIKDILYPLKECENDSLKRKKTEIMKKLEEFLNNSYTLLKSHGFPVSKEDYNIKKRNTKRRGRTVEKEKEV